MNNKYVSTTLMTPSVLTDIVKMLGNGHLALFFRIHKISISIFFKHAWTTITQHNIFFNQRKG